jgi:hypothetical protein
MVIKMINNTYWIFCGNSNLPFRLLNYGLVLFDPPKNLPDSGTAICTGFTNNELNSLSELCKKSNKLPVFAHVTHFNGLGDQIDQVDQVDQMDNPVYKDTEYQFENSFKIVLYGDPKLVQLFLDSKNYRYNFKYNFAYDEDVSTLENGMYVANDFNLDKIMTDLMFVTNSIYLVNFSTDSHSGLAKLCLEDIVDPNRIFENMEIII